MRAKKYSLQESSQPFHNKILMESQDERSKQEVLFPVHLRRSLDDEIYFETLENRLLAVVFSSLFLDVADAPSGTTFFASLDAVRNEKLLGVTGDTIFFTRSMLVFFCGSPVSACLAWVCFFEDGAEVAFGS